MKAILQRYVWAMLLLVASFVGLSWFLSPVLLPIVQQNGPLNITIISLMVLGMGWIFAHIYQLQQESIWLDAAEKGRTDHVKVNPKLLKPLAMLLNEPTYTGLLTPMAARSLLVSIEERLDTTRDVPRYLAGLLIFLGLLGTFWGLSKTIGSIADLINTLNVENAQAFSAIKEGLQGPLSGMGTAFSCSMLGLAGSLLLGCLDLQYGKAAARFYNYIEEKVSLATRVGIRDEAAGSGHAFSQSLLEQTLELTHKLYVQMQTGEDNRSTLVKNLSHLTDQISKMSQSMMNHQDIMYKIAQNQLDLQGHLASLAQNNSQNDQVILLQKILTQMDGICARVVEEMSDGRQKLGRDLTNEIRMISRTLSSLANDAA